MATLTLPAVRVPVAVPSDAELLSTVASLLAALPGPFVGPRLSTLVEYVCVTCCPAGAAERAQRLELALAEYLHRWRVLRAGQVSPDGLDAWAAGAPITFLRAALAGCARCRGGEAR
jgi:hypothetical protein